MPTFNEDNNTYLCDDCRCVLQVEPRPEEGDTFVVTNGVVVSDLDQQALIVCEPCAHKREVAK